jgi:hypothetical protein
MYIFPLLFDRLRYAAGDSGPRLTRSGAFSPWLTQHFTPITPYVV